MSKLERIAHMTGKTTFHDLREGFGHGIAGDSDADIKGALGIVATRCGDLAAKCLQTRYASTLAFEAGLRRAWWAHRRVAAAKLANRPPIHVARIGGALGIRALAGLQITQGLLNEWAWIAHTSQAVLREEYLAALTWGEGEAARGARVFLDVMQDIRRKNGEAA